MTTKVCSKCKVEKELGEFGKHRIRSDGLSSECKICAYLRSARWKKENREKERVRHAKWRAENPEKAKAGCAKYRAENPEKVKAASSNWYTKNKEKVKARNLTLRSENPEKARTVLAKWRAENPEKVKAYKAKCISNLEDPYVKDTLKLPNPPQELIELKRIQIRIHREIYKKGDAES